MQWSDLKFSYYIIGGDLLDLRFRKNAIANCLYRIGMRLDMNHKNKNRFDEGFQAYLTKNANFVGYPKMPEIIKMGNDDSKRKINEMRITENKISNDSLVLLKSLLGKTLNSRAHETYTFSPTSCGAIYMTVDKANYILIDYYEQRERIGVDEEVSVLRFRKHDGEFTSTIKNEEFVSEKIDEKITLVNTNQMATNKRQRKLSLS